MSKQKWQVLALAGAISLGATSLAVAQEHGAGDAANGHGPTQSQRSAPTFTGEKRPDVTSAAVAVDETRRGAREDFSAPEGTSVLEVRRANVADVASRHPDWFAGLWDSVPGEREVFVVLLRADDGEFIPRERPGGHAKPMSGDTLVQVVDSENELRTRFILDSRKTSELLREFRSMGSRLDYSQ